VGDAPGAVAQNRRLLREALALPAEPVWLDQVHGTHVLDADAMTPAGQALADAAVTHQSGQVLAVLVADCLPVLLARQDGTAIGVAHAGWRGLAAGVIERTVEALGASGTPLQAWLGPAISAAHFEVGAEVRAAFLAHDEQAQACFSANARGRWQCDLPGLARQRLMALGIRSIEDSKLCTFGDPARFFSYRREGQTGRIAALIWIEAGEGP
jgi:YfiH family protein